LLIVPALILEDKAANPLMRDAAHVVNWIVWLAFWRGIRRQAPARSR
jgi:hypothetical protein